MVLCVTKYQLKYHVRMVLKTYQYHIAFALARVYAVYSKGAQRMWNTAFSVDYSVTCALQAVSDEQELALQNAIAVQLQNSINATGDNTADFEITTHARTRTLLISSGAIAYNSAHYNTLHNITQREALAQQLKAQLTATVQELGYNVQAVALLFTYATAATGDKTIQISY